MIGNICPISGNPSNLPHEPIELEGEYGERFKDTPYTLHCCKHCGVFYLTEEENVLG